ncbi:MAG TPA: hypothetical protein VGP57_18670 [Actinoplanes sp.]|nr:hypothetical protein [Actinoplanes sp.]
MLRARYASILDLVGNPLPADKVVLIGSGTQGRVVTGSVIDRDRQVFGRVD